MKKREEDLEKEKMRFRDFYQSTESHAVFEGQNSVHLPLLNDLKPLSHLPFTFNLSLCLF